MWLQTIYKKKHGILSPMYAVLESLWSVRRYQLCSFGAYQ